MKKLLFVPVLAFIGIISSCDPFDTSGNESSATCLYYGAVEKYEFSDTTSSAFSKYIGYALEKDSIINMIKTQSVKTNVPSLDYAYLACDELAKEYYKGILNKSIRLDDVKRQIFSSKFDNDTIFPKLISGYDKYTDLPINEFKVCLAYINYSLNNVIRRDTIYIK